MTVGARATSQRHAHRRVFSGVSGVSGVSLAKSADSVTVHFDTEVMTELAPVA